MSLKPGDRVRVKDYSDICKTLDANNCCEGLLFSDEMKEHSGNVYVVLKQVNKIIDYYNKGIRIFTDTYILDGVHCEGSAAYPECDRMCFFFWKKHWLEKLD